MNLNNSVVEYYTSYGPNIAFTTIILASAKANDINYVKNYNLTYSLKVIPLLQLGPYYFEVVNIGDTETIMTQL